VARQAIGPAWRGFFAFLSGSLRTGTGVAFWFSRKTQTLSIKEKRIMNNSLAYNSAAWLDQVFNDFDKAWGNTKSTFSPAVDVVEEKEDYVLRAELPGVSKENIKVEVKEKRLTVSGKKDSAWENKTGEYRYVESTYGTFSRSFELPRNVSGEAIRAEHQDGVLTLRIPKAKESQPVTIEIK
jgi:HSP20 family protein